MGYLSIKTTRRPSEDTTYGKPITGVSPVALSWICPDFLITVVAQKPSGDAELGDMPLKMAKHQSPGVLIPL